MHRVLKASEVAVVILLVFGSVASTCQRTSPLQRCGIRQMFTNAQCVRPDYSSGSGNGPPRCCQGDPFNAETTAAPLPTAPPVRIPVRHLPSDLQACGLNGEAIVDVTLEGQVAVCDEVLSFVGLVVTLILDGTRCGPVGGRRSVALAFPGVTRYAAAYDRTAPEPCITDSDVHFGAPTVTPFDGNFSLMMGTPAGARVIRSILDAYVLTIAITSTTAQGASACRAAIDMGPQGGGVAVRTPSQCPSYPPH